MSAQPASGIHAWLHAGAFAEVPTPALVVDVAAARENHRRVIALMKRSAARLWPHFKAHKCTALARIQTEGAAGVSCQTTWEALALVDTGFSDIMLTNEVVDALALKELAAAACRARLTVLADDISHVTLLQQAARAAQATIRVLIEVDVGMHRCGVPCDSTQLVTIADAIAASPDLRFGGIQAYEGHASAVIDPTARRRVVTESAELARIAVARLEAGGHAVATVGGGSTGNAHFIAELGIWTDIQAGSYLLMDGAYAAFPDLGFASAVFGLLTVIHSSPGRIVLDGGLKQFSVDRGAPLWPGDPAATPRLSDEHTRIDSDASRLPGVGERVLLMPRHLDPTVNLHPALWLSEDGKLTAVSVDGRMPERLGSFAG
jgi:D-serine deaminase-like pyridoxal phosphate-dependent protein